MWVQLVQHSKIDTVTMRQVLTINKKDIWKLKGAKKSII